MHGGTAWSLPLDASAALVGGDPAPVRCSAAFHCREGGAPFPWHASSPPSSAPRRPAPLPTQTDSSYPALAKPFQMNAFQLLRANLDISAIFEGREDVVKRRTRLTCGPDLADILQRVQAAVEGVGGHVARRSPHW